MEKRNTKKLFRSLQPCESATQHIDELRRLKSSLKYNTLESARMSSVIYLFKLIEFAIVIDNHPVILLMSDLQFI